MDWGHISEVLVSLFTLTLLETVLGVDNLVFIAIVSSRLAPRQQKSARKVGLMLAWVLRLLFLSLAIFLIGLTQPLFSILSHSFSGKELFLLAGGLFLLVKATSEIHTEFEEASAPQVKRRFAKYAMVITQIAIFDIVFSIDSILTAVGLIRDFWIMATAITIAIIVMIVASEPLSQFIQRHPTIKMLALSFLILIGMVLIADGFGFHIPRGYIYFAICFSIFVEMMNYFVRKKRLSKKKL